MNITEDLKVKRNLTALVEFSRVINSSFDLDFILNNVLLTCMGKFLATKGLIALKSGGVFHLKAIKGFPDDLSQSFPVFNDGTDFMENKSFRDFMNENGLYIVEQINSSEECLGFISLGQKLNQSPYTNDDREFLRTILNISSTAIQNSKVLGKLTKVNRELDSKIHRLNSLFELSKELGLFSENTKVAKLLVYSVIGQFLVSKFAVIIFDKDECNVLESKINEQDLVAALGKCDYKNIGNPVKKSEIKNLYPELDKLKIRLIVPMQLQGETKGLIILGKRINNMDYSEDDIEFIYSVGSLAIISLENQRLFKEALEKQKLEEELDIARDIQKNLLPRSIPVYSSFEVAATNISSRQVGGDYYDVISLDKNSFCVTIADVVGKGVPAALLMANMQAFLKIICKQGMKIDEATGLINDLVSENITDGKFITFFWAVIENDNLKMEYVNAGHNPPLLIRNGSIIKLCKGGMILGVLKTTAPYISEKVALEKDDVVVLFTDGISEAKDINDDEFSNERLEEIAVKYSQNSAQEILSSIQKEVQDFAAGTPQSDDLTLMVLKVK
jgi:sigma-B regulation protein RsbU (phosphoserine phosphatase)